MNCVSKFTVKRLILLSEEFAIFKEIASIQDRINYVHHCGVLSFENIAAIFSIERKCNPIITSLSLADCYGSLWRIWYEHLQQNLYKIKLTQEPRHRDHGKRKMYAE